MSAISAELQALAQTARTQNSSRQRPEGFRSMLTIPMGPAEAAPSQLPAGLTTVLVIGRSEQVLRETVDLARRNGRVAGATNDFDNVLALFDIASLDTVVFGGMVPRETKENLRNDLATANPAISFVQGLAGIPGLIAAQIEANAGPSRNDSASVDFDSDRRAVALALDARAHIRVIGFWGTSFVPPDPESTSELLFEGTLGAGTHTVPLPAEFPTVASFIVVYVDTDVHPFAVGPMPRGTTAAGPA